MAITRAQQFRQMLKNGNVAVQGGVKNYLGEQETVSDVPIKWKSGPNKPATELAYITDAEKKLLLKEDIHGSLKDGPNEGPKGIMSLDSAGDRDGPVGGFSGEDVSAAERGETPASMSADQARGFRAGAISAGAGIRDTDDLATLQEANRIAKASRDRFAKQQNLSFRERANLFNLNKKQKFIDRLINQRQNKILAGLNLVNLNPAYDEEDQTFSDLISNAPSIAGMTDKFSQKTIDDVLAGNRQIDFFTPTGSPTFDALGSIISGPVTQEKLESLNKEISALKSINPKDTTTKELMKEFAPNQYRTAYPEEFQEGGGDRQRIIPIVPQVSNTTEPEPEEEDVGLFRRFRADGGIMNSNVVGGEFDFESARQMYGLGKLVKKVTRTVKKIAKSPVGKAAIGLAALKFGPGLLAKDSAFARFMLADPSKGFSLSNLIGKNLTTRGAMAGIAALSAAPLLFSPEQEEDDEEDIDRGEGLDIAGIRANPNQFLARRFVAEGGSMKEPVAKKTMPLLDLDGKEMDLRAEGGFVPIGRMEKADDVPARLSKNEFVFTADAVRNAGDGDVDKGAEVMYNMMKNLESGGDVSKESQGLEGARRMFQTSQRLEEVL